VTAGRRGMTTDADVEPRCVSAFVYVLRCGDGSLYCGWTTDVQRRLRVHRTGRGSRYVSGRLPAELVLVRPMPDRRAALREEARIKRLTRAQKLELVAHDAATAETTRG
jgi:putative endonuclease